MLLKVNLPRVKGEVRLFDLVPGRGDGFTPANRAAAGGTQPPPFFEGKVASPAGRRFHGQALGVSRPGNVLQMIKNLSLPDAEDLGYLTQVEGFSLDGLGNFLP